MAWGNFVLDKGFNVAAAVTKFRAVELTAAETVQQVNAITDEVIGWPQISVSTAELAKGKGTDVRVIGVTEAEANGAIAVGQRCQLNVDGTVSAYAAASGKRIVGLCVGHPSTNSGDRISMLIFPGGAIA